MRLSPDTFWSMSLREWRAAVEGFQSRHRRRAAPLARAEFDAMMRSYPDRQPKTVMARLDPRFRGDATQSARVRALMSH